MNIVVAPKVLLADPEALAMYQAFYSRSKRGIEDRLSETGLDAEAIKAKLKSFFVGYGHDSIGQCGYVTFFIEGVSILADKAIQHDRLYNGQESSTRYINFKDEPIYVPDGVSGYEELGQDWITFYTNLVERVQTALVERNRRFYSIGEGHVDEAPMLKACKVKAFDICSAFLPNCVTTNLSWTTSLANLNKNILRLAAHSLPEVRDIAAQLNELVKEHYPSIYIPLTSRTEEVHAMQLDEMYSYSVPTEAPRSFKIMTTQQWQPLATRRTGHMPLPHSVHQSYIFSTVSELDYRSFRDVQRHRTLNPSSPLVDASAGIYPWYTRALEELEILQDKTTANTLKTLMDRSVRIGGDKFQRQYVAPMGTTVRFSQTGYLGDWLYYAELRTGETVHPTVVDLAAAQWHTLSQNISSKLLYDLNDRVKRPSYGLAISFKRAAQDIVERT